MIVGSTGSSVVVAVIDVLSRMRKSAEFMNLGPKMCHKTRTLIQAPALGLLAVSSSSLFDSVSNATDHNLRPASAPLPRAKSSARPHFPAAMRYLSVADGYYNFIYQS